MKTCKMIEIYEFSAEMKTLNVCECLYNFQNIQNDFVQFKTLLLKFSLQNGGKVVCTILFVFILLINLEICK